MLKNNLIPIKEKFSLAYLHAIAAQADIVVDEKKWSIDKMGMDVELYKNDIQTLEGNSFTNYVKVQLKGTSINTSMVKETSDSYTFNLHKDLTKFPNMYFVLVILPSDKDYSTWLRQNDEEITIFRCAYFLKLKDNLKKGTLVFPKSNLLTPAALLNMFKVSKENFLDEY